jgi:aromatic-amino-acid transaminase
MTAERLGATDSMKNDTILLINQAAQERKKKGIAVVNGSIGMMYLDDGTFPVSEEVRSLLAKHTLDADLSYSSVAGPLSFREAVRHWFLGHSFDQEAQEGSFACLGTPGGTGALALALSILGEGKCEALLPEIDWPNYESICSKSHLPYDSYALFDSDHAALGKLAQQLNKATRSFDSVVLLVNDPCENPTGYCLSESEWHELAKILSNLEDPSKVRLVIDAAYIDYGEEKKRQAMIESLKSLPPEMVVAFVFSFSKTFSFYGLRLGSLAFYSQDKKRVSAFFDEAVMGARAEWSVPNHMAMNAVEEMITTPRLCQALQEATKKNREIVAKRATIFLSEAKEAGLEVYPYVSGFFVTLHVPQAFAVVDKLMEKNIFVAPIKEDAIRIALCCLPTSQVSGLARAIAEAKKDLA